MFYCERCETKFNPTVAAASGDCPRCRENEGISSQLRFRLFDRAALKVARLSPTRGAARLAPSQSAK